jgi:hypothetical protein
VFCVLIINDYLVFVFACVCEREREREICFFLFPFFGFQLLHYGQRNVFGAGPSFLIIHFVSYYSFFFRFSITGNETYSELFWMLVNDHDYATNTLNLKIDSVTDENHSDNEMMYILFV